MVNNRMGAGLNWKLAQVFMSKIKYLSENAKPLV